MIDASRYTIQIKLVEIEGNNFYQAKIKEFPYLDEYADCAEDAYKLALDAIETSIKALTIENKKIPFPCNDANVEDYSGRVTLRIPKTLHASLAEIANFEGISLNQLLASVLADFNGFNHSYYHEPVDQVEHAVHKHQIHVAPRAPKPVAVDDAMSGTWSTVMA